MWAAGVVEVQIASQGAPGLRAGVLGPQVNFLVLDGAPQSLDEDIVSPATLAVHADTDVVLLEQVGKCQRRELTALVGIEDLWRAVLVDGIDHGIQTELHIQGDRYPP